MTAEVDDPSPRWAGVGPALEILALWALAGAQPVFDLFGRNAEFFLAADAGPGEILAFTLAVAFAVPLVLILVESAVRFLRPAWGPATHRVLLGLLAVVLGLNVARQVGADHVVPAVVIAGGFVALVLFLAGREATQSFLRYLGVAPLAFAVLFLFSSDAGSLVFSEEASVVEVEEGSGGPVAVLVFDELPLASLLTREGEINELRFPNFARLADQGIWYRNATAVAPSTPESVPTILTGEYPEDDLLPTSADRPVNLFTLLGGEYDVTAFEGLTDLCPDSVCAPAEEPDVGNFVSDVFGVLGDTSVVYGHLTLPEPLRDGLPSLGESWAGFLDEPDQAADQAPSSGLAEVDPADDRDELSDFLEGVAADARSRLGQGRDLVPLIEGYDGADGTMLVGHDPFLPHRPWHITPQGNSYDSAVGGIQPGQEEWPESPAFVRRVLQRHLLQVGYADRLLGELLDTFEAAGTLEDATIVVTADHGMAFQPGGRARDPNADTVQEIYRVPMIIKAPGQTEATGRVSDQNALLVDVVPTVLDLLDIEPPAAADFDGQSLVSASFNRADDDKPVFYGQGPDAVAGDLTALYPAIFRNVGYVGDGNWVDLLRVGPAGHFVARDVDRLRFGSRVEADWVIDQAEALSDIEEGPVLPLAVSGRIDPADDDQALPTQVLVVLDGVVAGVGDLDREDGTFAALLDERRLTPGPHEVELLLPTSRGTVQRIVGP